jgi:radical SAM superfamily enzyme YgiQ (UPF0313 family)
LKEALKRIRDNRAFDDLPNVGFLENGGFSFTKRVNDMSRADDEEVDWRCVPDSIFKSGVIPIQASYGCPYRCAYCTFPKNRRLLSIKPLDRLIAELKTVADRGARYVWFVDDNFRLGSPNLEAVCRRFIEEDLAIRWMSFVRASSLKRIDADLLRRSGCVEVQLGLESADPTILRNMNKDANPEMYADVVRSLLSVGINCSCYFIFGFPGETDETAEKTRAFIRQIEHPELDGALTCSIFPFVLAPLSPIYEPEMRKGYGLEGYLNRWKHRTMDSEKAQEHILKTFLGLENSGIIYRDDNQDLYLGLEPQQRKRFVATRHKLSKLSWREQLTRETILRSFEELFPSFSCRQGM